MAASPVLLGRPGDLVPHDGLVDCYTTRIGGTPVLPPGCHDMPGYCCSQCGAPMVLLLQTHAPLTSAQVGAAVHNRFLYLLGCLDKKCPGSWKALRCQPPGSAAASEEPFDDGTTGEQQPNSPQHAPAAVQVATGSFSGVSEDGQEEWGAAAAGWGTSGDAAGGWGEASSAAAGASSSSAFDFDDLDAALDAVQSTAAVQRQAAPRQQQPQVASCAAAACPSSDSSLPQLQNCYARPCLPAFYILAEPEPQSAAKLPKKERAHLQQLLSQYEQDAGQELAGGGSNSNGVTGAAVAAAGACLPAVESAGGDSWGGEGYEPDAVLHAPDKGRGAGRALRPAFLKFSKRLAACADQCARYSFGSMPLWPGDELPTPTPCAACGAPTVFELQLMAPAIHYLEESADWLKEGEEGGEGEEGLAGQGAREAGSSPAILRPPPSWEWATVAVYSCTRSCAPGEGARAFVEEQVFVENE